MTFDFTVKQFILGGGTGTPTFQFYRRGFNLGGSSQPSWKDITISGIGSLTLVNAKENGLNYVKIFGNAEQAPETYIDSVTLDGKCEQNGTPTPSVPVDIVCNNGAIKCSPNLANMIDENITVGYYISATGTVTADTSNFIYNKYIPVKPNTTYTLSMSSSVYFLSISEYSTANDSGFILRNQYSSNVTKGTLTTGATTNYIRFGANISRSVATLETVQAIDWMLTQSSTATPYRPYGEIYYDGTVETVTDSNGLTATAQPLLSVGDYKDTQEVLSGAVTRNVGVKVLDGSELWENISGFTNLFYLHDNTVITDNAFGNNVPACICSHFKGELTTVNGTNQQNSSIKVGYSGLATANHFIYIKDSAFNNWTAAQLKQWLTDQYSAGTPVIVVYPLETATTETVSGQQLNKEPVTVTGSLTGLVANVVSSSHTTPKPTQPLDIVANNGVIKLSPNLFNQSLFNTETPASGTAIKYTSYQIPNGTYTMSTDFPKEMQSQSSITNVFIFAGQTTSGASSSTNGVYSEQSRTITVTDGYYTIAYRSTSPQNANNPADYNWMLAKGSTATTYRPYGSVYYDGTVETVAVGDLYDSVDGQGTYVSPSSTATTRIYKAFGQLPDGKYKVAITGNFEFIFQYKDTDSLVPTDFGNIDTWTTGGVYDLDKTGYYYGIAIRYPNNVRISPSEFNGTIAFIPLDNSATAQPLLKVGDYQDVQNVLDGSVTRNVGVKVLDGTEGWGDHGTYSAIKMLSVTGSYAGGAQAITSTHYVGTSASNANMPINSIKLSRPSVSDVNGTIYINTDSLTLADFKTFLADQYNAGFPVIVVYPLAEPTTESVTGQPLTIQAGTNIVEITQASIDNLELEVSYKAGVEVTVEEVENAQLDDDVTVIIS